MSSGSDGSDTHDMKSVTLVASVSSPAGTSSKSQRSQGGIGGEGNFNFVVGPAEVVGNEVADVMGSAVGPAEVANVGVAVGPAEVANVMGSEGIEDDVADDIAVSPAAGSVGSWAFMCFGSACNLHGMRGCTRARRV